MLLAVIILLLYQLQLSLALSTPFGSFLPDLIKNASSRFFNHGVYIDQKVDPIPHSFLNHEQWHHRYSIPFMNASSTVYMTLSAPTGFPGTISLGSALTSASAPANYSISASLGSAVSSGGWASLNSSVTTRLVPSLSSTTAPGTYASNLASLLGPLEDLQTDKSADWDDQTESACSAALVALHGVATNPSGIAACYNIKSLESLTGIFGVDLRLYRISAPTEGWLKLNPSTAGVGLTYINATISPAKEKRSKREDQSLPWFPAQRDEAADIYIRRSIGIPPRRLESMNFLGTVDNGAFTEMKNR